MNARFKMTLPIVVEATFDVFDEDGSYSIAGIKPITDAAVRRSLSSDDAAMSIEAEIETRKLRRKGVVG